MARRYEVWVHGLEVHVQNEPQPLATAPADFPYPNPRRNSQGTRVRQDIGGNWFHFAVPAKPIILRPDGDDVPLRPGNFYLRGSGNGRARLTRAHVWTVEESGPRAIFRQDRRDWGALDGNFNLELGYLPDFEWTGPLAIDLYIEFDDGGDVTLGGVGVEFSVPTPMVTHVSQCPFASMYHAAE